MRQIKKIWSYVWCGMSGIVVLVGAQDGHPLVDQIIILGVLAGMFRLRCVWMDTRLKAFSLRTYSYRNGRHLNRRIGQHDQEHGVRPTQVAQEAGRRLQADFCEFK